MFLSMIVNSPKCRHRPQSPKELFNLWHAMARNVIERIFSAVKRRFCLMVASPEYSEEKQAKFVPALCVLHNFILVYDSDVPDTEQHNPPGTGAASQSARLGRPRPAWISEEEEVSASVRCDRIADAMWADYNKYLADRGTG